MPCIEPWEALLASAEGMQIANRGPPNKAVVVQKPETIVQVGPEMKERAHARPHRVEVQRAYKVPDQTAELPELPL